MKTVIYILTVSFFVFFISCNTSTVVSDKSASHELSFPVSKHYLNLPVSPETERSKMKFEAEGIPALNFVIRLAPSKPVYWVFFDISSYKGKVLKITYTGDPNGMSGIYQDDVIAGNDSLYREINRPQLHFTSRRGWNNDPNGLVYFNGEYHMFYQHNPFECKWENMSWGHAVSRDLLHWKELNVVLLPDTSGSVFSGSAVIDNKNTSGWGKNTMVAFFTAAGKKMTQCIAYSTDSGRSFTRYKGNPVLGADRDPKVFWYEPTQTWVMVLYNDNYNAIYNSKDMRKWEFKSKTEGFYECPELFQLPVDGNIHNKKWVMYGASGTYMTGSFDGEKFMAEHGKYFYSWGSLYAAQTFNNTPDGRRIQIGWGTIEQKGMPFNQMMLFPCELSLRTTPEGIRLYCEPVRELEILYDKKHSYTHLSGEEASEKLSEIRGDLLHVKMDIEVVHGVGFEIHFRGNRVAYFDGNFNQFNGAPYICDKPGSLRIKIEFIIDKTSFEAYVGNGKLFISEGLKEKISDEGLKIKGNVKIHSLELNEMKSIWPNI